MRVSQLQVKIDYPDPRLKSEQFRADVRLVLDALSLENKTSNFMLYQNTIDWTAYAQNLRTPRVGMIVEYRNLPGVELLKWIDVDANLPECFRFLSFW